MSAMRDQNVREQALQILYRVETQQAYATRLLAQVTAGAPRDLALLQQLVKGTLDWRGAIDGVLDPVVKGGLAALTPWIRNILRLGAYQILYLDRIPPEVAVSEAVELAKRHGHRGTVGLVNAVLRKVVAQRSSGTVPTPGAPPDDAATIAVTYSHPAWLVQRWVTQLGPEATAALCAANNRAWPLSLRTNTLKVATDELRRRLHDEGLALHPAQYHPDCTIVDHLPSGRRLHELATYRAGLFQVQDESAAFVADLVDPQPGELVVDLCSAPGGKTTHLAALMGDRGRIVAVDPHAGRLRLVQENCARLGISSVDGLVADGRSVQLERPADRVLVDAPCSGLGALGRRSDARWNKSEDDLSRLHALQVELLEHAATLLKPGGRLVYSTCTVEPLENDGTVEAFLRAPPEHHVLRPSSRIPAALVDDNGYYRTWPHRHGMGGAFGTILINAPEPGTARQEAPPDGA